MNIWINQSFTNGKWVKLTVKQKLKDLFLNSWYNTIETNDAYLTYKLFKKKFGFERYLIDIPHHLMKYLLRFRTNNHRLPIESGRWTKTNINERTCTLCNSNIGDEYHYLLECKSLDNERKQLIPTKYLNRYNTIQFDHILNTKSKNEQINLCKFLKIILSNF